MYKTFTGHIFQNWFCTDIGSLNPFQQFKNNFTWDCNVFCTKSIMSMPIFTKIKANSGQSNKNLLYSPSSHQQNKFYNPHLESARAEHKIFIAIIEVKIHSIYITIKNQAFDNKFPFFCTSWLVSSFQFLYPFLKVCVHIFSELNQTLIQTTSLWGNPSNHSVWIYLSKNYFIEHQVV